MIEIKRFGFSDKALLKISNKIRTTVFIEEQNVERELEYEYEEEGNFYLLYYDDQPIATARWRETANGIKLERFAMLKEFRNRGLGGKLLIAVMEDVIPFNKTIYLHSQVNAITYYERAGFVKKGDVFVEANIKHYLMEFEAEKQIN
ncbi:MAG: GNAT family N-acetyltransferase [Bacteroidales bacterium]|nr:GNAT family N-acetyltransferase [Bacteroidales bacterium]